VFFTSADITGYRLVVGAWLSVAQELFPDEESPLGKYVMIGTAPFQVVGIMTGRGYQVVAMTWITRCGFPIRRQLAPVWPSLFRGRQRQGQQCVLMKRSRIDPRGADQESWRRDFNIRNMADLINTAIKRRIPLPICWARRGDFPLVWWNRRHNIMLVS